MEPFPRNRGTRVQRFDVQQHGRVVWATNAGNYNNFLFSLIKASQIILFVNTSLKAMLYLLGVLAMSGLCNILNLQDTITADRHNTIAQYFINQSWTLSLILLGIYNILTSNVYNLRNVHIVCAHILRLMLGMVWCWFFLIFDKINSALATCSPEYHTNSNACLTPGGYWYGFSISLDIFLMIHCALAISEEAKTYKTWNKLGEIIFHRYFRAIKVFPNSPHQIIVEGTKIAVQMDYNRCTPIVTVIIVCLAVLLLVFDFILVVSVFYNCHTTTGNIVAAILAIVGWYINYRIWDPICRENDRDNTIQTG